MRNLWVFILLFIGTSCDPKAVEETKKVEDLPPYSLISDRKLNFDTLRDLVWDLDTIVNEPSSFWADLANDSTYHPFQRAIYAGALLRRHVKDSPLLTQLTGILKNPNWIKAENIGNRCFYRGGGNWKFAARMFYGTGSTFCIRIFTELEDTARFKNIPYRVFTLRIGVNKDIPKQNFSDFILKGKTDSVIKKTYIIAIG
jgi:hypothetical protein